ncbi:response regulator [Pseudanabaena sp. PCC 6802]|uniref:response regulator n=1 Tax=Pseudanabaena sp. PCC 6802 TaxID=118173 RepID=UPI00038112DC|nr:response regulator [Pseudanabaena sp. PCC 6802]
MKILLVEDDEALITVLTKSLTTRHNCIVDVVKDGEAGWNYGSTFEYDLILLDIQLPKLDGISLCQRLRSEGYTTPIVLLTTQNTSTAKVQGLDAGADDYVVKPFDVAELSARIRALLRRSSGTPFPLMSWGDLLLNPSTCDVSYNSKHITLTTKEYRLLEILLSDSQHVFSTEEILDRLWSSEDFPAESTVRSHIRRLRHKLMEAGAPADFIATIHGRGYYLKAPDRDAVEVRYRNMPLEKPTARLESTLGLGQSITEKTDRAIEQQAAYLAFLNETWVASKPQSLEQLVVFSQVVQALQSGTLTEQLQTQANQTAHKLAGTLGTFGLNQGMQLARQLESLLDGSLNLGFQNIPLLKTLVLDLQQEIQNTISIENFPLTSQDLPVISFDRSQDLHNLPLLLVISGDSQFAQALERAALSSGLRTAIAPTREIAQAWLDSKSFPGKSDRLPRAILWQITSERARDLEPMNWLQTLALSYPDLPILVIGDRNELTVRLEVVRRGGTVFLEPFTSPEQAIDAVRHLLSQSHGRNDPELKVMIVDDDRDWLRILPTSLAPWGLKVTTLEYPQEFWTILQAVMPDVLVLDVNMPEIDGFELCQVVRSDPRWQKLPILFLSGLSDRQTQNRAFTVGADDYLCKPVVGADLAHRILNRMQRLSVACSA